MVTLNGKGFTLRPFREGDEEALARDLDNEEVTRYMTGIPHPYSRKDAEAWIRLCKTNPLGTFNLAITTEDEVRGGIGLDDIDGHKAELSYWLTPSYWGREIMTAAVRLMADHSFSALGLQRLYAYVDPRNRGSRRVLEKAGFEREGLLRNHAVKDGESLDRLVYGKVR